MATKVTTKKPLTGNRRSHSLRATKMKVIKGFDNIEKTD